MLEQNNMYVPADIVKEMNGVQSVKVNFMQHNDRKRLCFTGWFLAEAFVQFPTRFHFKLRVWVSQRIMHFHSPDFGWTWKEYHNQSLQAFKLQSCKENYVASNLGTSHVVQRNIGNVSSHTSTNQADWKKTQVTVLKYHAIPHNAKDYYPNISSLELVDTDSEKMNNPIPRQVSKRKGTSARQREF